MRHGHFALQETDGENERLHQISTAASYGVDTYDWTEVQKANQVAAIDSIPGVDTFWSLRDSAGNPVVHPRNYAPISWKSSLFRFVEGKSHFVYKGVGGQWPARWFCRVVLENLLTRQLEARVSAHMISGIQSLHDETEAVKRETIAGHNQCVAVFAYLMQLDGLPTIGGTDANDTNFIQKMAERGNFQFAHTGPTHPANDPRRRIDFVLGFNLHLLEAS